MRATIALAGLALAATALAAAPASNKGPSICKPVEHETIVCDDGTRILRVIRETTSPSGRFAMAWSTIDPKDMNDLEKDWLSKDDDIKYHAKDVEHVRNYLVRLSDGKIIKQLEGAHFGDSATYNNRFYEPRWSRDSRFLLDLSNLKWRSEVASAYYIGKDDRIAGPYRIALPMRQAARSLLKRWKERRFVSKAPVKFAINRIDDTGIFKAAIELAEPKQDGYSFAMTMRIKPVANMLTSEVLSIKRTEEFGDPED
jgi:hypothetical protein